MRFRLPLRRAVFALALFVFALVALVPMRVGARLVRRGRARARGARGGGDPLARRAEGGAVRPRAARRRQCAAEFLPLLLGRARLSLCAPGGARGLRGRGLGVAAQLRHRGRDRGAARRRACSRRCRSPRSSSRTSASRFAGGLCESATGEVRANLSGDARRGDLALGPARRGALRRRGGAAAARRPVGDGAAQYPDRGRRPLPDRPRRPRRRSRRRPAPARAPASRPGRAAMCGDSTAPSDRPSQLGNKPGLRRSSAVTSPRVRAAGAVPGRDRAAGDGDQDEALSFRRRRAAARRRPRSPIARRRG